MENTIISVLEKQIEGLIILGYKPVAIQMDEDIHEKFLEECKRFIKTQPDKPEIGFTIIHFMGLPVSKNEYKRLQLDGSKGFISPIQVTIKTYHKGE
jgi:hypothetical protein